MKIESKISRKVRLRHLRCFVTVARNKSFHLAAVSLGLTQPAVSRSVRELEQILGHDLFDRKTRGAQLSDRGRIFLESAEAGLLHIMQGTDAVTGSASTGRVVRIGALPNVCSHFLPMIIKQFKKNDPDVCIEIAPGTNSELLDRLRRGEADFVIGRLSSSEDMKGLAFEALYDEPLVFVVRPNHPLTATKASLQDAISYPMLLPLKNTIIWQEIARFLASKSASSLRDVIETTSSEFQRTYLETTDSVAIIPRGVIQRDIEQGTLVELNVTGEELRGPVGLTTNPALQLNEAVQLLLTQIRVNL